MPLFGGLFKSKDGSKPSKSKNVPDRVLPEAPKHPRWQDSWERTVVNTDEIHELIHLATQEMKSRDLDAPFFLLPFRPDSDISSTSSAQNFVQQYFKAKYESTGAYTGANLSHELLLTEPLVLFSIMKWCWSRLPGGVVTWETYEMFRIGEEDSNMAVHSFDTFIPLSVENDARKQIIFDFFDLLAAVSARSKTNGLGGRKLSRLAGWWAFELSDGGKGFDGGYTSWSSAANACSHLFFAYLRSLSPESQPGLSGISPLPRSLQALLSQTEYPPQIPALMHSTTPKVVMIVDNVSPTPFALLRRTSHFEYRDEDRALQQFSTYDDPVRALTDECRRVLEAISSTNQSDAPVQQAADSTWSRFQSTGFAQTIEDQAKPSNGTPLSPTPDFQGMRSEAGSRQNDFGRPTTPSWADFLTTGFSEDTTAKVVSPVLLPPDKQLPPIVEVGRVRSSQSHVNNGYSELEPGELASIGRFELDDTFWWVWITSLSGEETAARKAVFGRCALIEVEISGAKWLLVEEQIKGASPRPEKDAYIAEKKSKFSLRNRLGRRKSTGKKQLEPYHRAQSETAQSKTSISPDQQTRIQQAAAQLAQEQKKKTIAENLQRRGRNEDQTSLKTNSVLTLQPAIMTEAVPAMKWAKEFDKDTVRAKYLGNREAGTGRPVSIGETASNSVSRAPSPAPALSSPTTQVTRKAVTPTAAAPLPITPTGSSRPADRSELVQAADVTLPEDKATAPEPQQPDLSQHPAYRSEQSEAKPPPPPKKDDAAFAARKAWERQQAAPYAESAVPQKDSPKKLKKSNTSAGAGFKRFLGRGKKEKGEKERSTTPVPPAKDIPFSPITQTSERPSNVSNISSVAEDQSIDVATPVVASPAVPQSAAVDAVANGHSVNNTAHQTQFSQGPLEDVPAFVPEDNNEVSPVTVRPQEEKSAAAEPADTPVQPEEEPEPPKTAVQEDNQSEKSLDLERKTSPTQDRWAQIRKNAAERAARVSEEQARQDQSLRTEEGDTSGEETIENRVARIKARVAELTGSMDSQGNIKTSSR